MSDGYKGLIGSLLLIIVGSVLYRADSLFIVYVAAFALATILAVRFMWRRTRLWMGVGKP
jgi:hypothetical protein